MTAMHARLALAGLVARPGRTVLRIVVVAAAIALLAAMLLFIGNSLRSASAAPCARCRWTWQGPVSSARRRSSAAQAVAKQPGVARPRRRRPRRSLSTEHRPGRQHDHRPKGAVLAVPANYSHDIHTFRLLQGSLQPGGVVLDQQMAATLQAQDRRHVRLMPPARRAAAALPGHAASR